MLAQFSIVIPEILLASLAMIMQLLAVYLQKLNRQLYVVTSLLGLSLVAYLLYYNSGYQVGFGYSFASSEAISLFKAIVLGLGLMSIVVYSDLVKILDKTYKTEFVTLILFSTLGAFIAISARDFVLLFCGLELQALSGYALAAFSTKSAKSSEAGLKYFILGALMSGLMLLGISFLYGYSGSIKFIEIKQQFASDVVDIRLIIGAILVFASILFKLSAAPMHIWTPDVYEGAPISVVSYFAAAQKVAMLIVLINITDGVIAGYHIIAHDLVKIAAIISMIIGSLGALKQNSLKRLMAYSTILNVGYVLVGVTLTSPDGNYAAFVYILIYSISVMCFFSCLVALLGTKSDDATFEDIQGVASQRKTLAACISIIMFSMIGLPPLAGFFGKYYLFLNAISEGEIILALVGFITSVIAAFYYLKVIKYMYFMEPINKIEIINTKSGLWLVTVVTLSFVLFFFMFAHRYIL